MSVTGKINQSVSSVQSITDNGQTILVNSGIIAISGSAGYNGLNIEDGTQDGQMIKIINVNDNNLQIGSNISGGGTTTIAGNRWLGMIWA